MAFLMWSETVSMINLQTLKSMLNSAQNASFLLLKLKKISGVGAQPLPKPHPFVSPQFVPSSQYLWIRH